MAISDLGADRIGRFGRYWFSLAQAAGGTPERAAFDPASISSLLANIIIVEHLSDDDFRYRLLGTGVDWFARRSYTGQRTSQIDGHGPGNMIHAVYTEARRTQTLVGCTMPYVGRSSICRRVRKIGAPFRTETGQDQIISLLEFDLVIGVEARLLSPAKRWVL